MAPARDRQSQKSERLRLVASASSSGERQVTTPSAGQLRPGELVGGYQIEELIHSGALARVYRARQLSTGRTVALKLLLTRYLADGAVRRRMRLQARALSRVQHANVVTVYDVSVDGDVLWIAMELLPARTLRRALRQRSEAGKRATLEESLRVALQIAAALQAAHAAGVVHGDLKPENVFVLDDTTIKVSDFTTATFLNAADVTVPTDDPDTVPDFKGTPRAMAPELFYQGFQPDPHSDVYSLGLILYEMLAGRHLIPEQSPFEHTRWIQLRVPPKAIPGLP